MSIPTVESLTKLGFEDSGAVHLYLYALVSKINPKLIRISSTDKALLHKLNIVKSEVLEDAISVSIDIGEEQAITYKHNTIEGSVDANIDEYRKLFAGKKSGSMGSKETVRQNLKDFLYKYPQYDMQQVIAAAKRYIASLENFQFMRQADYFIFKQQYPGAPKTSTLLEVLESPEEFKPLNTQWTKMI